MSEQAERSAAGELLIRVEAMGKSFETGDGTIEVLRDLDFDVRAGERIAVLGQSGVGKSTLLHILGTLDHPSRGRVLFRGEDVFAKSGAELARLRNSFVGFVFQFHHLLPEFSALENVMMPGLIRGLGFEEMRERGAARGSPAPRNARHISSPRLSHSSDHCARSCSSRRPSRITTARPSLRAIRPLWVTTTRVVPRLRFMSKRSSAI
jgi:lipoprotein-releasing system ATP-binding protein